MSKDLERAVKAERDELKARKKKMAEFKQPHDDIADQPPEDPIEAEKKKLHDEAAAKEAFKKR